MAAGRYLIAEVKKIDGNVDDILLQGLETQNATWNTKTAKYSSS